MSTKKSPQIRFKGFIDDWEQYKLGGVVDFLDGQRKPLEAGVRESGIYPYYGASGIIDYVKDYLFDEELILLSEDGANIIERNYRVCFLATGKYWVNNHAHVMKSREGYSNEFICESLEMLDYTQYNTGTAQPKLNKKVCAGIPIFIPKIQEQKQIGNLFTNIDNLITLHQRKLELLKDTKKSMLQKMFPKEGTTVPEIRFEGFTGDWEEYKIEKLLEDNIIIGHLDGNHGALYPKSEEFIDDINEVPYITANDFATGEMNLNNCRHLPLERAKQFRKGIAKDGDVLFAHNATVGPVTILRTDRDFCILSTTATYFRCDLDQMNNLFLGCSLQNEFFVNQYKQVMKQSTRDQVPILTQRKFDIRLPNIIEQRKIGKYLSYLDNLVSSQQKELDLLKDLKKTMLQQMFI